MSQTRFLTSSTRTALLSDLAQAGFEWKDEQGNPRIPEPFEQTSNGNDSAIYLGKIQLSPAVTDDEGEVVTPAVISTKYHANVTACEGITFTTEQEAPENPYNVFA